LVSSANVHSRFYFPLDFTMKCLYNQENNIVGNYKERKCPLPY
jgi:hypothetical protein